MSKVRRLLGSFAVAFGASTGAAALEIDQPLSSAHFQIPYYSPVAQSFNVSIDRLGSIAVLAAEVNAFGDFLLDRDITLTLREGSGVGGAVLKRATVDAASVLDGGPTAWVSFNLGGVAVVPAAQYTFQLEVATPRFGISAQQDSAYTDGRAFFTEGASGQSFGEEYDLTFRIAAVDEPPAVLLLLAGTLGLLARRIHRQRGAPARLIAKR